MRKIINVFTLIIILEINISCRSKKVSYLGDYCYVNPGAYTYWRFKKNKVISISLCDRYLAGSCNQLIYYNTSSYIKYYPDSVEFEIDTFHYKWYYFDSLYRFSEYRDFPEDIVRMKKGVLRKIIRKHKKSFKKR